MVAFRESLDTGLGRHNLWVTRNATLPPCPLYKEEGTDRCVWGPGTFRSLDTREQSMWPLHSAWVYSEFFLQPQTVCYAAPEEKRWESITSCCDRKHTVPRFVWPTIWITLVYSDSEVLSPVSHLLFKIFHRPLFRHIPSRGHPEMGI